MTILDDDFLALLRKIEAAASLAWDGSLDQIGSLLADSLYRATMIVSLNQVVDASTEVAT